MTARPVRRWGTQDGNGKIVFISIASFFHTSEQGRRVTGGLETYYSAYLTAPAKPASPLPLARVRTHTGLR